MVAQAPDQLRFRGNAVTDPVPPVHQQVLEHLLGLRVQGHPPQRGGGVAGSLLAGRADVSGHILMLGIHRVAVAGQG
jgi:hypothetical protein